MHRLSLSHGDAPQHHDVVLRSCTTLPFLTPHSGRLRRLIVRIYQKLNCLKWYDSAHLLPHPLSQRHMLPVLHDVTDDQHCNPARSQHAACCCKERRHEGQVDRPSISWLRKANFRRTGLDGNGGSMRRNSISGSSPGSWHGQRIVLDESRRANKRKGKSFQGRGRFPTAHGG